MSVIVKHSRTTSTDDSDVVVLTCPSGKVCQILNVHVVFTSTATVGNRRVKLIVQDSSDVLVNDIHAGAVQAASLTYHYNFMRGVYRETTVIDSELQVPMPEGICLLPGWDLRILDGATIDVAADDMVINVVYKEMGHTDCSSLP